MMPDKRLETELVPGIAMEHERELLKHEAESLRTVYSLTGPARKDYTEQMAEAESLRVKLLRQAEAEGLLAIRKAEAEGYRMIGEVLSSLPKSAEVIEVAKLHALQRIAGSLADGKATKLFLPQNMQDILGMLGTGQEVVKGASSATTPSP